MKNLKRVISVIFVISFTLISNQVFAQTVPKVPVELNKLKKVINSPDKLDFYTTKYNIEPKLINYHLATTIDMGIFGLNGKGVHLPIQISKKYGGRKSIYLLKKNEEVLSGIIISNDKMFLRYITRLTGDSKMAKNGDLYRDVLKTKNGKVVFSSKGKFEIVDMSYGYGKLNIIESSSKTTSKTKVWVLFSCILVENE